MSIKALNTNMVLLNERELTITRGSMPAERIAVHLSLRLFPVIFADICPYFDGSMNTALKQE